MKLTSQEIENLFSNYQPRPYQIPILKALDNECKRVLAILPRRAGKDITALNYVIKKMWEVPGVYYYIFPTYSQAKKVIWDAITNDGQRVLDYFPTPLVLQKNAQEMKIKMWNKEGTHSLFQLVGSDNYDCFDDKTEILTREGWKLFKNILISDEVATLNKDSLYFEWQNPIKLYKYDFNGKLYSVQNSSTNFAVTDNHRFFVKSEKGKYKFKEISDPTIKNDMIPAQCNWKGKSHKTILVYDSYEFMRFLGIFLSEGCTFKNNKTYRITISQIKPQIRRKIKRILKNMGLNYYEHKTGFNIENKKLYEYCSQLGAQHQRFIPKEILNLSKKHLAILFEYLILGDGHKCKCYTAYYSTSKKLIDNVQEIIIKLGFSGNVRIKPQNVTHIKGRLISSKRILYEIRVRTSKYKRLIGANRKRYIKKISYKGKVYCISVPNSIVKVRRNGFEMWSGNSLMGTNPRGVVFSEYALQDPRAYQYIRPILNANNGWAIFISTPRGHNHLWEMYQLAKNSPAWFTYKLTLDDTQHIPIEKIDEERSENVSEDHIQQEYYTSFDKGIEGTYYAKYVDKLRLEGRIGDVPWENGFKVHTAWDIGMRDATSIIFFQTIGQTVRFIDAYENSNQGLEHYIDVIESKPYSYGKHIAPHDIKVREWTSGMTRLEKARQLGVKFTLADDLSIPDGIEAGRSMFSKLWIDENKCRLLIKALENYRKEYDAKKRINKPQPLHDFSSHFADAYRYLSISYPKTKDGMTPEDLDKNYRAAILGDNANLPPIFRDDISY